MIPGAVFEAQLRSNINRGQENVIVGGQHNEMLYTVNEEGAGVYNRWSVIVGGIYNQLAAEEDDFTTKVGLLDHTFIGRQSYLNVPEDNLHIQVGPVNE